MYKIVNSIPIFFKENGDISYECLERYIADLIKCGADFIYAMAFNTRYMQLTNDEILHVHKFILDLVKNKDIKIYLGHPYLATKNELDNYFKELQDNSEQIYGISMLYPERFYGDYKIIEEFYDYPKKYGFKTLIHEMKFVSGYNGELIEWPEDLLIKILEKENIVGVKEDSKNDEVTNSLINHFSNDKHIIVAGHGKKRTLKLCKENNNYFEWLNGSSIVNPKLGKDFCDKLNKEGPDSAYIKNYIENFEVPFFEVVKEMGWHMAHKYILSKYDYSIFERFPLPNPTTNDSAFSEQIDKIIKFSNEN